MLSAAITAKNHAIPEMIVAPENINEAMAVTGPRSPCPTHPA